MMIYNIHTPSKTFALSFKDDESYADLLERIGHKAGLDSDGLASLKAGKDGSSVVYEYEAEKFSLEDDGDLQILQTRLPPASTSAVTLHLTPPQELHAHFDASPVSSTMPPPSYSAPPATKKQGLSLQPNPKPNPKPVLKPAPNGTSASDGTSKKSSEPSNSGKSAGRSVSGTSSGTAKSGKPKSISSVRSRRSKWGDDEAEPLGDVHKRLWLEFHSRNGVRTVVGKVGDVPNVRMLLKSGYRSVTISRRFAVKHHLVDSKYNMGAAGYMGFKTLGSVPITVGTKTGLHPAFINEEEHFDVVLGRAWLEKMGVKVDGVDQTVLTYMDNGESIPCDIVVLKDDQGNVITIT